MVTRATDKVTSWSFSRLSDYTQCPAKFRYKHLMKLQEPPNAAMQRGTDIHKMAEDYANGALKTLPKELALFKAEFTALKAQKIKFIEDQWAFTVEWGHTRWNDWNNCWLRVKLDAAYVNTEHNALVVIDHKTGKMRDENKGEYMLQLELYGLAGLLQQPEVDVVSPRLWYIDAGVVFPDPQVEEVEYFRKDEKALKKTWAARVKPMFTDTSFKPKPNDKCRWCHYRKDNGGPCQY